jgi:hypothetical protein
VGCWFQFTWSLGSDGLRVIQQILSVGDIANFLPQFIALIIIDVVTAAAILGVVIRYQISHDRQHWTLFVLRYWHAHLFNVLAIPNMMMSLLVFAYLGRQCSIIILILSLVTTVFSVFHYLVLSPALMRSPDLAPSRVHAWNPPDVLIPVLAFGLLFGVSGLFENFHWIFAFLSPVGAAVIAICHFFLIGIYFPFKGVGANALSGAIELSSVTSCLIAAVRTKLDLPDVVVIVVLIDRPWVRDQTTRSVCPQIKKTAGRSDRSLITRPSPG